MGLKASKQIQNSVCSFLFQNTSDFSSCAGDSVMGLCCVAEFLLGRREFVDWTICPVLIGITLWFLGRCSEELKFLKGLHTMDSNKNYEDIKSGLVPCCTGILRGGEMPAGEKWLQKLWWACGGRWNSGIWGFCKLQLSACEILMCDLLLIQLLNSLNFQCGLRWTETAVT